MQDIYFISICNSGFKILAYDRYLYTIYLKFFSSLTNNHASSSYYVVQNRRVITE